MLGTVFGLGNVVLGSIAVSLVVDSGQCCICDVFTPRILSEL